MKVWFAASSAASGSPRIRRAAPYTASSCSRTTSSKVTAWRTMAPEGRARRRSPPRTSLELNVTIRDAHTPGRQGSFHRAQPRERLLRHREPLPRRRRARFDPQRRRPDVQRLRERLEERAVRRAIDRRRGHPDLQDAVAYSGDRGPRGARDEAYGEAGAAVALRDLQIGHV